MLAFVSQNWRKLSFRGFTFVSISEKKLFPEKPNSVIGLGKRKGKGGKYDTVLYTDGKQFSR